MEVWGWILVYAGALTVLQALVYRYLWRRGDPLSGEGYSQWHDRARSRAAARRREREEDARRRRARAAERAGDDGGAGTTAGPDPAGGTTGAGPAGARPAVPADDGGRTCANCGAVNEADGTFTRCWNCTEPLG